MCVRMRTLLKAQEDPLQITSMLSWCHYLWPGALSVHSSRLVSLASLLNLLTLGSPPGSAWAPLPMSQLRNSLEVVSWGNSRALQICFLCVCVCFSQAAGKISPFYSILSGIPQPVPFSCIVNAYLNTVFCGWKMRHWEVKGQRTNPSLNQMLPPGGGTWVSHILTREISVASFQHSPILGSNYIYKC